MHCKSDRRYRIVCSLPNCSHQLIQNVRILIPENSLDSRPTKCSHQPSHTSSHGSDGRCSCRDGCGSWLMLRKRDPSLTYRASVSVYRLIEQIPLYCSSGRLLSGKPAYYCYQTYHRTVHTHCRTGRYTYPASRYPHPESACLFYDGHMTR